MPKHAVSSNQAMRDRIIASNDHGERDLILVIIGPLVFSPPGENSAESSSTIRIDLYAPGLDEKRLLIALVQGLRQLTRQLHDGWIYGVMLSGDHISVYLKDPGYLADQTIDLIAGMIPALLQPLEAAHFRRVHVLRDGECLVLIVCEYKKLIQSAQSIIFSIPLGLSVTDGDWREVASYAASSLKWFDGAHSACAGFSFDCPYLEVYVRPSQTDYLTQAEVRRVMNDVLLAIANRASLPGDGPIAVIKQLYPYYASEPARDQLQT
jgi:hypothetical protein